MEAGRLASSTDVVCFVLGTFDGGTTSVLQIGKAKNMIFFSNPPISHQ